MHVETTRHIRLGRWTLAVWLLCSCGDDTVAVTDTASGSGTGTTQGDPSSTSDIPTTNPPTSSSTDSGMTDGTASATDTPTTPTTDTTQGVDTESTGTTGSTGDTDTTDTTDTGVEVTGRSVSQTVNAGHLVTSPNFRLVFTLGQPTQNQATTSSPNFKLRGGLVGANGSPP